MKQSSYRPLPITILSIVYTVLGALGIVLLPLLFAVSVISGSELGFWLQGLISTFSFLIGIGMWKLKRWSIPLFIVVGAIVGYNKITRLLYIRQIPELFTTSLTQELLIDSLLLVFFSVSILYIFSIKKRFS